MKSFKQHLDERCWSGYKPTPGKKAYSKGSCVKEEVEELEEGNQPKTEKKPSKNKNVKRPEVATFSHMIDLRHLNLLKKPKKMAKEEVEYINEASFTSATSMYAATRKQSGNKTEQPTHNIRVGDTVKTKDNKKGSVVFVNGDEVHVKGTNSYYPNAIQHHSFSDLKKEEVEELEEERPGLWANIRAKRARGERMRKPGEEGAPTDAQIKAIRNEEIELDEGEAWTRKEGQSESGGLNRKGIESYRRANPGSKLSMAVTTKPSKLKPGSKAANRRKSFCARMGGMKRRLTSAKTARDPDSRINKALRKWNC
jgi:hypothetical protein